MKLIGTESGRVLQLFRAEEIRPASGAYLPRVFETIRSRYQFATPLPDLAAITQSTGAKFNHGHIERDGADIGIPELSVFNDGVIVTCLNTDLADIVTDDLFDMMVSQFNFRRPSMPQQRIYTSIVTVELDLPDTRMLGILSEIGHHASTALNEQYGWDYAVSRSKLEWRADPLKVPHLRNTQFGIERRAGVAYEEQRYWCTAPLTTLNHLAWLEKAEKALLEMAR